MVITDMTANETESFTPYEKTPDDETDKLPCVRIGDVLVFIYSKNGVLRVSVDLDDCSEDPSDKTDYPSPFRRYSERGTPGCIPMKICVQGETVFKAGTD